MIGDLGLIEFSLRNIQFNWSNMREDPNFGKLDRVFVLDVWERNC